MRAQALLLELARHLSCYLELGAAAAAEYRNAWARRIVLALVALATGIAGLGALWAAGLVAAWDTPWRLTYVVTTALVLLITSGVALYGVLARPATGSATGMLKSELHKDLELLQEWKSST